MSTAVTVIRIAIQDRLQHLDWTESDRDATLSLFLYELGQVVTPVTVESMAELQPERFVAMFLDWAKFRTLREQEQRIALLVQHVAKNATGVPFGYASATGDKDLEIPSRGGGNVISLF